MLASPAGSRRPCKGGLQRIRADGLSEGLFNHVFGGFAEDFGAGKGSYNTMFCIHAGLDAVPLLFLNRKGESLARDLQAGKHGDMDGGLPQSDGAESRPYLWIRQPIACSHAAYNEEKRRRAPAL